MAESRASSDSSNSMGPRQEIMSEAANKHVRDKYRDLLQNFQEQTGGGAEEGVSLDNLQAVVRKANEAFSEVNRPREAAMDAQLLRTCGTLVRINIESSQSNLRVFKPAEFARKLIGFAMPDDDETSEQNQHDSLAHLVRLGTAVSGLYKRAVGVEPMYSAIEWERPAKPAPKPRERVKDKEVAAVTRPTEVTSQRPDEEGEAEVVSRMYKVLKQRYIEASNNPLCFFSFVVDPDSYSRTIENIFNTSLLVREQLAGMSEDNDGLPMIAPLQKNRPTVGGTCKQCIISLSKSEWKEVVDTFEIKRPMIPPPKRLDKRKQ